MGWYRDAGMNAVAGERGEVTGSLSQEIWEQQLNLPLVEGVGLTSVNNSDNHYIHHRHLPQG